MTVAPPIRKLCASPLDRDNPTPLARASRVPKVVWPSSFSQRALSLSCSSPSPLSCVLPPPSVVFDSVWVTVRLSVFASEATRLVGFCALDHDGTRAFFFLLDAETKKSRCAYRRIRETRLTHCTLFGRLLCSSLWFYKPVAKVTYRATRADGGQRPLEPAVILSGSLER